MYHHTTKYQQLFKDQTMSVNLHFKILVSIIAINFNNQND